MKLFYYGCVYSEVYYINTNMGILTKVTGWVYISVVFLADGLHICLGIFAP